MHSSDNVVPLFPNEPNAIDFWEGESNKIVPDPTDDISQLCRLHITALIDSLTKSDLSENIKQKDLLLLIETLHSAILNSQDVKHPLQVLAECCIEIDDTEPFGYQFIDPVFDEYIGDF